MIRDEGRLLKRLQKGERDAFAELLDRDGARVRSLVLRLGVPPSDADDLTQEIWLAIFAGLPSFRGNAALSTWIYRVALNHCFKWRHKRGLSIPTESDDHLDEVPSLEASTLPPRMLERGELRQQVRGAIEELSEVHRAVIVLHEMQGLTYAQCAQVLDVPIGTVKSRLSNAFASLRARLEPYVLDEEAAPAPRPKTKVRPCAEGGTP